MKQAKSLILAGILACTLSFGAKAGEMGTPGISDPPPPPGEMGTPGAPTPAPTPNSQDPNMTASSSTLDATNAVMLEIALALSRIL